MANKTKTVKLNNGVIEPTINGKPVRYFGYDLDNNERFDNYGEGYVTLAELEKELNASGIEDEYADIIVIKGISLNVEAETTGVKFTVCETN